MLKNRVVSLRNMHEESTFSHKIYGTEKEIIHGNVGVCYFMFLLAITKCYTSGLIPALIFDTSINKQMHVARNPSA
jgi:hypothetical protein